MKKWWLILAVLLLALYLVTADDSKTCGDFKYILLNNGTAELTRYSGRAITLTVPSELDGYLVTKIRNGAFAYGSFFTEITIPDHITSIGSDAFKGCLTERFVVPQYSYAEMWCKSNGYNYKYTLNRKTINKKYISGDYEYVLNEDGTICITDYSGTARILTIPESLNGHRVTGIADHAFGACSSLRNVEIPNSVVQIGTNPFSRCRNLISIHVSPSHPVLAVIDGVLFDKIEKKLICYPLALPASNYAIPDGIISVGEYAFDNCDSLKKITVPDSVTRIGNDAFVECSSLTSVSLPSSTVVIGFAAFAMCESLTSVSLQEGVIGIAANAFNVCESLTTITIPNSVIDIGKGAFDYCPGVVITVNRNSYAEQWCIDNNLYYTYPNANDWLLN